MATATRKTIEKEVVTKTTEEVIELQLTKAEATMLITVLGSFNPRMAGDRNLSSAVFDALSQSGVKYMSENYFHEHYVRVGSRGLVMPFTDSEVNKFVGKTL